MPHVSLSFDRALCLPYAFVYKQDSKHSLKGDPCVIQALFLSQQLFKTLRDTLDDSSDL